ncbi:hypothetical protein LX36DRAFT_656787, partial [Colletotrichum falcatum]
MAPNPKLRPERVVFSTLTATPARALRACTVDIDRALRILMTVLSASSVEGWLQGWPCTHLLTRVGTVIPIFFKIAYRWAGG